MKERYQNYKKTERRNPPNFDNHWDSSLRKLDLFLSTNHFAVLEIPSLTLIEGSYPNFSTALFIEAWECLTSPALKSA